MMAEMKGVALGVLAFALFFSFVVLAVQFNSLKLPILILGCVPFCMAGLVFAFFLTGLPTWSHCAHWRPGSGCSYGH